ncbi:MAG: DNA-binding protein [Proteobacteria bacterium]|nr:DNA-binding protein [Pseudomonadota bacterium]
MSTLWTVKQMAERNPAFSESSLRFLIFNASKNGIDRAIKRIGRKILIDEEAFFGWVEDQNMRGAA